MNSLEKMEKMEEELAIITSIYAIKVSLIHTNPISLKSNIIYIHRVENALSALDEQKRELINNDFFHPSDPMWWKSIYTTKIYLSLRSIAVGSFLAHFYEM